MMREGNMRRVHEIFHQEIKAVRELPREDLLVLGDISGEVGIVVFREKGLGEHFAVEGGGEEDEEKVAGGVDGEGLDVSTRFLD